MPAPLSFPARYEARVAGSSSRYRSSGQTWGVSFA